MKKIQIVIIVLLILLIVEGCNHKGSINVKDSSSSTIKDHTSNMTQSPINKDNINTYFDTEFEVSVDYPNNWKVKPIAKKTEDVALSPYISITATSLEAENHFYIDKLIDHSVVEKYITEDTSQYPLGVVDSKNERVYYSHRFGHADQLVMYDMVSGEVKQLTHNLYAINMIIPTGNEVYMLASTIVNGTKTRIKLMKYDFNKEDCEIITDDITEVVSMSYCSSNKSIYFSCYNWQEQMKLKEEYSNDNTKQPIPKNARYTINKYNCSTGETEGILTTDLLVAFINISSDGDTAILRAAEALFGQRSVYLFDMNKKEILEEIVFDNISRVEHIAISPDKKGIYFTGIKKPDKDNNPNQYGVEAPPNALLYMDFETQNTTEIASFNQQFINNFLLCE